MSGEGSRSPVPVGEGSAERPRRAARRSHLGRAPASRSELPVPEEVRPAACPGLPAYQRRDCASGRPSSARPWRWRSSGRAGRSSDAPPQKVDITWHFSQLTSLSGVEEQPTLSPDGRWIAYVHPVVVAQDIFLAGVGGTNAINLTVRVGEGVDQQVAGVLARR